MSPDSAVTSGPIDVGYDRRSLRPTIVHIGPGVFHRAHQAVYSDALLRAGSTAGAIWEVSMRSSAVRDALAPTDFVYHLFERSSEPVGRDRPPQAIGSIVGIDVANDSTDRAIDRLADPATTVVTITVTEHGYCSIGPGGALDLARGEVQHDVQRSGPPRSMPGVLVAALARRRADGSPPFTVVSCDNLPANGRATRRVVCELADHLDPALSAWIERNVAFPSSMVDRMVPETTAGLRDEARRAGFADRWPIVTEPFSQWVLEDAFSGPRPAWEDVGVELVPDVSLHEQAKLRILNAAHSALAYWGLLAGHELIASAASDPVLLASVRELIADEVIPTSTAPAGWNLAEYAAAVLTRFANAALAYTTAKVAGDGSQKLPVRLMPTIRANLAAGRVPRRSAHVLAAWIACTCGPRAASFAVHDAALTPVLDAKLNAGGRPNSLDRATAVDLLLGQPGLLDHTRPEERAFAQVVAAELAELWDADPRAVLLRLAAPDPGGHP